MLKLKKTMMAIMFLLPALAYSHDYEEGSYQIVERPRQECWTESVAAYREPDPAGTIIGGVAGGLIGNMVGRGNGRVAATAVGAVTGSIVGNRLSSDGYARTSYRDVQRCRTVMEHVRVWVPAPAPAPVVNEVVYVDDDRYYHHHHHHHHHDWWYDRD